MRSIVLASICCGCAFSVNVAPVADDGGPADGLMIDAPAGDAPVVIDVPEIDAPAVPSCTNAIQDGSETDLDCGGSCGPCAVGDTCAAATDCLASICEATTCRVARSCHELHQALPALGDAAYTLDPDGAAGAAAFTTYCDMTIDGGGWTLIGKVDGKHDMHTVWLRIPHNAASMITPVIDDDTYACVGAVDLAVTHSTELRLTNTARTLWVKWPLPAGRTTTTWWNHGAGQTAINNAADLAVTATSSTNASSACFQNIYGINPWNQHGGAYPAATRNAAGNTSGNDWCMSVGTQDGFGTEDGFSQNGNGFDAPETEVTWPNEDYNVAPHVAVWLR